MGVKVRGPYPSTHGDISKLREARKGPETARDMFTHPSTMVGRSPWSSADFSTTSMTQKRLKTAERGKEA